MMKNESVRLELEFIRETKKLAEMDKVDKSAIIRESLKRGFEVVRLEKAIKLFSEEKVSTSEGAEIAGLSVGEFMEKLAERGVKPKITKQELAGSLQNALKAVK